MDKIERKALRAVTQVIQPALAEATPVLVEGLKGTSLKPGELKKAVRGRIKLGKGGAPSSATVDFGNLSYIAHFVDGGHVNPTAKHGLNHTPAHPFVRTTEEATRDKALEAYVATATTEIEKALVDGK
jgi:hypothetical protein